MGKGADMPHDNLVERASPVTVVPTGSTHDDPRRPEEGIALCLSGGGYRAMLFHLGALWRLNELGYLPKLDGSRRSPGLHHGRGAGARWRGLAIRIAKASAASFVRRGGGRRYARWPVQDHRSRRDRRRDLHAGFDRRQGGSGVPQAPVRRGHAPGPARDPPRFVINATNVQSGGCSASPSRSWPTTGSGAS